MTAEVIDVDFSSTRTDSVSEYLARIRKLEEQLAASLLGARLLEERNSKLVLENKTLSNLVSSVRLLVSPETTVISKQPRKYNRILPTSKNRKLISYKKFTDAVVAKWEIDPSNIKQVAKYTGITYGTIRRWRIAGEAPEMAIQLIDEA
jgi:hypothetical protein